MKSFYDMQANFIVFESNKNYTYWDFEYRFHLTKNLKSNDMFISHCKNHLLFYGTNSLINKLLHIKEIELNFIKDWK